MKMLIDQERPLFSMKKTDKVAIGEVLRDVRCVLESTASLSGLEVYHDFGNRPPAETFGVPSLVDNLIPERITDVFICNNPSD